MKEGNKDGWRGFLNMCLKTKGLNELNACFDLFLTHTEREEIAARYLIVRELLKGQRTQREIAQDLHLSIAKITRGSNELKETSDETKEFIKRGYD